MGGEGSAVRVHHLLGVAVVSGDESAAAGVQHSGDHLIHAGIHSLNGLDSSLEHAGVADHIAVCKVQDDHIVLAALNALDALGSDFGGAHLGLQVVGGNLGAGDDAAILALVGSLHAAVEEEGDVRVLLGLGNAQLGLAVGRQVLAQNVLQLHRGIGHLAVGHGGIVLSHADVVHLLAAAAALEAGKGIVAEDAGHLAGTVGAEVHEDNGVAVLHAATLAGDAGQHELIGLVCCVGSLDGLGSVGSMLTLAVDKGSVGLLLAIPVVITVHGVVTAGNAGDLAHAQLIQLGLQVSKEALAGVGIGVTAVGDAVQVDFLSTQMLCHLQHAKPVVGMAVHAAGTHQTHQVDGLTGLDSSLHVLDQHRVLEHLAIVDGLGDEGQLLVHDAACAHVGVADLGVAHLAVGQTDSHTGSINGSHRVLCHQSIQMGGFGSHNSVAEGLVRHPAEAIHDAQKNRFLCHKIESPLNLSRVAGKAKRPACGGAACGCITPERLL